MWYFSWILGLGLACSFAILNAMWLEVRRANDESDQAPGTTRSEITNSSGHGRQRHGYNAGPQGRAI